MLRQLPYVLQGLSSNNFVFLSDTKLELPRDLSRPVVTLLRRVTEPALLYRGIKHFIDTPDPSLMGQSFRLALTHELQPYLSLVTSLEAEIKKSLNDSDEEAAHRAVTLRRTWIWLRDATLSLRLLSRMVIDYRGKGGGEIISLIHHYSTTSGDPLIRDIVERMVTVISEPFYSIIREWIYDGELKDPFNEFFVVEKTNQTNLVDGQGRPIAASMWKDKYRLEQKMVPSIISSHFADTIFMIGKSLNFLRYTCEDAPWVEEYSRQSSRQLKYGDTIMLEQTLSDAYKRTMARVIDLMNNKFHLLDHLRALKRYLLLGQGDFIQLLMESIAPHLDLPANSLYRHQLTGHLDAAVRASNAQFEPQHVLDRIDARLLELSHGDIGWEVFTLEYKVSAPADVVVTSYANRQYLKVFNFLWKIKRRETALATAWRRTQTGARGVLGRVGDVFGHDWKLARGHLAEMIGFVALLQNYILFEVIEKSWEEFMRTIGRVDATLDTLVQAHGKYIETITTRGLLGTTNGTSTKSTSTSATGTAGKARQDDFRRQIQDLLHTIMTFLAAIDTLFALSVQEFGRRQDLRAKIDSRTKAGQWGLTDADLASSHSGGGTAAGGASSMGSSAALHPATPFPSRNASEPYGPDSLSTPPLPPHLEGDPTHLLTELRQELQRQGLDFRARMAAFLTEMAHQPDAEIRLLGLNMNANGFYPVTGARRSGRRERKVDGKVEERRAGEERVRMLARAQRKEGVEEVEEEEREQV